LFGRVVGESVSVKTGQPVFCAEPQVTARVSNYSADAIAYKAVGCGVGFYRQTFSASDARSSYDDEHPQNNGYNGLKLTQAGSIHIPDLAEACRQPERTLL